ncbi:hypothetical protein HY967_00695 [Candidatus Jorgensenbacteria bacterium]|nr:hypothetical protein [Candidatus Jorgensenbacteria bacterium]
MIDMSGLGATNAVLVALRIDAAVEAVFDDLVKRKDAFYFLDLAFKAGDWNYFMFVIAYGGLAIAIGFGAHWMAGFVLTILTLYILLRLAIRRYRARRDMEECLRLDPVYWGSISETLQRIVSGSGKLNDGWWPRQISAMVN